MHCYPALLIGFLSWVGLFAYDTTLTTFCAAPLITSGLALPLMLLPLVRRKS